MQELIDQMVNYARGVWRFRWSTMIVAWLVSLGGWLLLATMPDVYEARARVYVDTSSEISRLLNDQILDSNIAEELAYVRQSMLGRLQLEKVAIETDLMLSAKNDSEKGAVIEELAAKIQIQSTGADRRGSPDNLYTISYQHRYPSKANAVVSTVLNNFIEDTLGGRQSSSDVSRKFLLEQIEEYETRLQAAEQRLAKFNRENFDRLPGQQGGYFERLQAENAQLESTRQLLEQAVSRLERQKQQLGDQIRWVDESGVVDPGSIEGRAKQQQIRLEELLLRYTDNHPDVLAAKETITRLKAQRAAELLDLSKEGKSSSIVSNNPVYQALQISLNETEAEIAMLRTDEGSRQRRIQELRSYIDDIADVEARSARLNRDYGVMQAQYQALIDSLERERLSREAIMSENVEFRIIDPPMADSQPIAPPRIALVPAILVIGIGAGVAFALLLNQLKAVFGSARTLESYTRIPVVGSVNAHRLPDSPGTKFETVMYMISGATLVLLFGVVFSIEGLGAGFRSFL